MTKRVQCLLPIAVALLCAAQPVPLRPGRNSIPVRGVPQAVYYYSGGAGRLDRPCILFLPGDGGWRGFAVTVATQLAAWGYDVYGLDTRVYLEGFTGKTVLKEEEAAMDMRSMAEAVRGKRQAVLLGWSEGAGLLVLGAAAPAKDAYAGLITMGLGDRNVLAWRFVDNITYLTKRPPNEPSFSALRYMPRISPLPLVMMQSANDEYVGKDEANRLFNMAAEPKRLVLIEAQNHRFDGAQPEFFRQLKQALEWITVAGPKR